MNKKGYRGGLGFALFSSLPDTAEQYEVQLSIIK